MLTWLIVPEDKIQTLLDLNEGFSDRKCTTVDTIDGFTLTWSDKIHCPYWEVYHNFLEGLEVFEGEPLFAEDDGLAKNE